MVATLAAILPVSASALRAQAPPKGSGTIEITGPIRVIDGDTFEVSMDGRQTAIGIIGIKAFRINTLCGKRAAQLTQTLVNAIDERQMPLKLRFEEDEAQTFDVRKRRMYHLKLPGDVSVALALVSAGLAVPDGTGKEANAALAAQSAPNCIG